MQQSGFSKPKPQAPATVLSESTYKLLVQTVRNLARSEVRIVHLCSTELDISWHNPVCSLLCVCCWTIVRLLWLYLCDVRESHTQQHGVDWLTCECARASSEQAVSRTFEKGTIRIVTHVANSLEDLIAAFEDFVRSLAGDCTRLGMCGVSASSCWCCCCLAGG